MKKVIVTAAVLAVAGAANADFSGYYAPGNWAVYSPGDGFITWNAPSMVTIDGINTGGPADYTTLTIAAGAAGTFAFDWTYFTYDSPGWDEGGYIVNNTYYMLDMGYGPGSGSVSVAVNAGDTIGFYVLSYDGGLGQGVLEVYNFSAPVPAPGALALLGLAGLTARRRRR